MKGYRENKSIRYSNDQIELYNIFHLSENITKQMVMKITQNINQQHALVTISIYKSEQ